MVNQRREESILTLALQGSHKILLPIALKAKIDFISFVYGSLKAASAALSGQICFRFKGVGSLIMLLKEKWPALLSE